MSTTVSSVTTQTYCTYTWTDYYRMGQAKTTVFINFPAPLCNQYNKPLFMPFYEWVVERVNK